MLLGGIGAGRVREAVQVPSPCPPGPQLLQNRVCTRLNGSVSCKMPLCGSVQFCAAELAPVSGCPARRLLPGHGPGAAVVAPMGANAVRSHQVPRSGLVLQPCSA